MEQTQFVVVRNQEEQYSIWPNTLAVPAGWQRLEMSGSKEQCLEYIKQSWTDMTPASLRRSTVSRSDFPQ